MSNWIDGNEVDALEVTIGEHGEVTSWPDLPRGIYDIEVDPQAGMVRIIGHDGNTTGWRHAAEYAAQFAFGSDDPCLGPDAARWTPEDDR